MLDPLVSVKCDVSSAPLQLSVDPWFDSVEAIAFGSAYEELGFPAERLIELAPRLSLVLDTDRARAIGFVLTGASRFVVAQYELAPIWAGPRFAVPVLGLDAASVGEILLAIGGRFEAGEPTADAMHAHRRMDAICDPEAALPHWQLALEAGHLRAHDWLADILCSLGRPLEAYAHARRYTELLPHNAWSWICLGQTCEFLDWTREARIAYERALECDPSEIMAGELLADLDR